MIKNGIYYKALEVLEAQYEMLNVLNEEQVAKAVRNIISQLNTPSNAGYSVSAQLGRSCSVSAQSSAAESWVNVNNATRERTCTIPVEGLLISEQPTEEEITRLIELINQAWCNVNDDIIL